MSQKPASHGFKQIKAFNAERKEHIPGNGLEEVRKAAPAFRDDFIATGRPLAVHQFLCSMSPYPTVFGFQSVYEGLQPYLFFNNRATLVQFENDKGIKTLLFNPYFPDLSAQAGFYAHLKSSTLSTILPEALLLKRCDSIVDQLATVGLQPEDIDYVSYDHLHVQDMRPLMGTEAQQALFPNATFIYHKDEWEHVTHLHPFNEIWYVKDGCKGVKTDNLMLYEGDLQLGNGVALIHTPGHTAGNHSLYLNTSEGTFTISENGVGPDAYNPENSKIKSVREAAAWQNVEVILNANTRDLSYLQYNSMIKEKILSGPNPHDSRWCNHRSSSEFTSWIAAPGLNPSFENPDIKEGVVQKAAAV